MLFLLPATQQSPTWLCPITCPALQAVLYPFLCRFSTCFSLPQLSATAMLSTSSYPSPKLEKVQPSTSVKAEVVSRYRIRIWTLIWWVGGYIQTVPGNWRKMFFSFSYIQTFSHLLKKVLVTPWPSVWILLLQSSIKNSLEGRHGLNRSER